MAGVWDITTPLGTEAKSLGDDRIRELKVAVGEALRAQATSGDEAIFPGSAPTTAPVFRYRGLKGTTAGRPTAGQYGLYINTTLNTLQRDNGSTWDSVATLIPAGTVMAFYQASPPVGWTAVAVNDKFMRVVTSGGSGGTTGGSGNTPASGTGLAHTHTVASHTHDMANHHHGGPSHTHSVPATGWGESVSFESGRIAVATTSGVPAATGDNTTGASGTGNTGTPNTNTTSAAAPSTDSQLSTLAFQYADFCVGTKD